MKPFGVFESEAELSKRLGSVCQDHVSVAQLLFLRVPFPCSQYSCKIITLKLRLIPRRAKPSCRKGWDLCFRMMYQLLSYSFLSRVPFPCSQYSCKIITLKLRLIPRRAKQSCRKGCDLCFRMMYQLLSYSFLSRVPFPCSQYSCKIITLKLRLIPRSMLIFKVDSYSKRRH